MADNTTMWIVIAIVAAVLVLGAVAWAARNKRNQKLHGEAERIRGEVEQESTQVARREALAEETAAKARAAKAEAEVKAAEAARLEERALSNRSSAESAQDDLEERRAHADDIDPQVKTEKADDVQADDAVVVEQPNYTDTSSRATHRR